jgi:phenylalanyl-tRNA synthetase beta chain
MLNEADLQALNASGTGLPGRYGLHARPEIPLVTAVNPLRSEWEMMRPTMLPALLKNVAENVKFNPAVGVFETGRVYLPVSREELPNERRTLGIGLAGQRYLADLYRESRVVDYFDIKGIIDALVQRIGVIEPAYRAITHPSLHPGRAAELTVRGRPVGVLGELHPAVIAQYGIASERVAVAEIDLPALLEAGVEPWQFQPVARFQPVEQDFAIVVDEHVPAADVAAAIQAGAGTLGTDVRLFDIYRGQALGPGKKSLAYRVTLVAPDRVLAEHEIERIRGKIESQVKRRVGGTLRG